MNDTMSAMASQIAGVSIVWLTVCSSEHQRKHQGSTSQTFVRVIHRWPVDTHHKELVTRKMFPFDDLLSYANLLWLSLGKFDWCRYVITFLYVQFWIRLAVVSYHGKEVRAVASPAVISVNMSRDTRNCVQNEPEYAICLIFTTRLYYKVLWLILLILCDLIRQIRHNYNRLDDGHCDVAGHCEMSVLGTAGSMVTTHENSAMMWSVKGPTLFRIL